MNVWYLVAFCTALFDSIRAVVIKKTSANVDEYILAFTIRLLALPFLIPILFFTGIPEIPLTGWLALIAIGITVSIITIYYMKAIKEDDISLVIPISTMTPLFLLVTSPIIAKEFASPMGIAGVLLIVIGSYTLNVHLKKEGFFAPFKALVKHKGPRYMLIATVLMSIAANIDKVGINATSVWFWVVADNIVNALFMIPVVFLKARDKIPQIKTDFKPLLLIGFLSALVLTTQMYALSLTLVPYVISVKRFSAVLSVLWGFFYLKEKNFNERITGVLIMVSGVLVITLFS